MWVLLLVLLLGFFAQLIDGTLGMGSGASSSSFLLAIGLVPATVSASVHITKFFTSGVSGYSHFKTGNMKKRIVIPLSITGIIGGTIGAFFLAELPGSLMSPVVGTILLILGVRIFVKFYRGKQGTRERGEFSNKLLLPLGFVGGIVDALGGGGWGPVCTSTLATTDQEKLRYVIGSVNIAEFFTTIAIVVTFGFTLRAENYLWPLVIPLLIGGIIAAPIAATVCKKVSPKFLGLLIGSILIVLNTHTLEFILLGLFGLVLPINPEILTLAVSLLLIGLILGGYLRTRKAPQKFEVTQGREDWVDNEDKTLQGHMSRTHSLEYPIE